jgi:hypothetical protein
MIRIVPLVLILAPATLAAGNWPSWRGPHATGVSSEVDLPVSWSATENVAWQAPLRGAGVSSPVVFGDRVFVTSQEGSGVRRQGNHPSLVQGAESSTSGERTLTGVAQSDTTRFVVAAFDRATGRRVWEHVLEAEGALQGVHDKHNLASPSPVTDGQMVYAWFGTGQIIAVDMNGKLVWQRHLGTEISPFDVIWGHSSSPTLFEDSIILLADHAPASYLLALDKRTGKEKWKADRGKGKLSYSTPLVVQAPAGPELIVNSSERIDAYDPRSGAVLWYTGTTNRFPIPVPVFHDGVIYMSRGYRSGPYMAIRPGGRGDITPGGDAASGPHVAWRKTGRGSYMPTPLIYGSTLYVLGNAGLFDAYDLASGRDVYRERLEHQGSGFSSSPVAADGRVYLSSEDGDVFVVRAGASFELIAKNPMGEPIMATPALAHATLYVRGEKHLFAVGARR